MSTRLFALAGVASALAIAAACGTSTSTDAGVDAGCGTPMLECCRSCYNDVGALAVCVDGGWLCPPGTVSPSDCAASCVQPFCSFVGKPGCVACDGGNVEHVCDRDAGSFVCPPGTYDPDSDATAQCNSGNGDAATE